MDGQRVKFIRIEREQRAGNGGQHAADDRTISFRRNDEIVKMSASSFGKTFVGSTLRFILGDGDEYADVLERSYDMTEANARSIVDDVMDTIRNDVPKRNRLSVDMKTLFDDPYATSGVASAPAKHAPRATLAKYGKRGSPPLPKTPPHNNRPTWKNVPAAPTVTVRWTDGGRLEMAWTTKLMFKAEPEQYYELYYWQETDDDDDDVTTWTKCGEMTAIRPSMSCTLQCFDHVHTYRFAMRAVDVHGRRAPFATMRITPCD